MKKLQNDTCSCLGLCALMALPAAGQAQAPVPVQVQTPTAPSAQALHQAAHQDRAAEAQ